MKKKLNFTILRLALLLIGCYSLSSHAQVTIGAGDAPQLGSLLQLKENESTANNSNRGLGMPRVNLTNKTALYPMFETVAGNATPNTDYNDATKKGVQDVAHTGLMVYNLTNQGDFCPGLYVWDGGQWHKLGGICFTLDIDNLHFDFPSGRDLRPLIAKTSIVSWNPTSTTATWVNSALDPLSAVPFIGTAIYPTATLNNSPTTLTFLPDAMTPAEVAGSNVFKTKESKIDVTLGTSGRSKTITINQTNKALLVNGSTAPSQIIHTGTTTNQSITITSNAIWKMGMTASTAVTNLVPLAGTPTGTEKNDNTSVANTQKYNITVGGSNSRYTTLTFSDNENTKRFNDVSITLAQCSGTNDPTMAEWATALGTAQDVIAPNGVAWHRDQDSNIFFSMNYDTANPTGNNNRWMTTNLAAKTYGPRTWGGTIPTNPTNTYAWAPVPYTAAYWGYPNPHGTGNAGLATTYNARQRLGLLYNYAAANGNQNPSVTDQSGVGSNPNLIGVQGICPAGWHLPTDYEWIQLEKEIKDHASKYSGLADGTANLGYAMIDMCEPNFGNNKSNAILNGGFSALFGGYGNSGSSINLGLLGGFWTSSSNQNSNAWFRQVDSRIGTLLRSTFGRYDMVSVRCKKN